MSSSFDAKKLRNTILDMAHSGSTVHIGCAFSIVEILAVLYRDFLRYPDNDPNAPSRDFFILSKGHGVMAQYACLLEKGWIGDEDVKNYFGDGTDLKGLSDSRVTGLEVTSGSLGHGLSIAVGLALGAKIKKTDQMVYVVMGDGEMNEGSVWEALMFANHHKLDNLLVIIDENGLQAMGTTDEIIDLGSLETKLEAFGIQCKTIDGHDERRLSSAIAEGIGDKNGKVKGLVARTIKGKGVPFMENNNQWHYLRLNKDTYAEAKAFISGSGR